MNTECWLWAGATNSEDYGIYQIKIEDKWRIRRAHRLLYENFVGEIPEGLVLDHLCRVTRCVNPGHLEAITNKENILRGISPSARNALKTHCPNGHEYTKDNIYWGKNSRTRLPMRRCRICHNHKQREYRKRTNYPGKWAEQSRRAREKRKLV